MEPNRYSSYLPYIVYWTLFAVWMWLVVSITESKAVRLVVFFVSILSYPLIFEWLYAPLWKRIARLYLTVRGRQTDSGEKPREPPSS